MTILDIALSSITFLTLREKLFLKKNLDSLDKLAVLSIKGISEIVGRSVRATIWNGSECARSAEKAEKIMKAREISALVYSENGYPALLSEIKDAPYALFYRGNADALLNRSVSVVGTRRVSEKSAAAAMDFAKDAALDGNTVISGLAYGIDSFAHRGALASERHGSTVAVLPCGIDTIVPSGHRRLAGNILLSDGCLVSEYIPGTPAEPWRFVQRNRIIAGLSPATVVVHAPAGSGALITADFALDYNRELMFHSAGLGESRKKIPFRTMDSDAEKNVNAPEKYLSDGAPVIGSYADYVAVRKDAPGMHICRNIKQLELFS